MTRIASIGFAMALLLYGCHRSPLHCRSEYLYPDYLASARVLTPDPYRDCFFGQQVVIRWDVGRECLPLTLVLHVRYGTREQATFTWPVDRSSGYRIYRMINEEYWLSDGIISYKAELCKDGEPIADWRHHLWVDLIEIAGQ
ncbi:MAG: hypothetical protein JJU12_00010 [Chlamydiales bacterium]|nr:hypothetical protein [Chlamydiales bacterium]